MKLNKDRLDEYKLYYYSSVLLLTYCLFAYVCVFEDNIINLLLYVAVCKVVLVLVYLSEIEGVLDPTYIEHYDFVTYRTTYIASHTEVDLRPVLYLIYVAGLTPVILFLSMFFFLGLRIVATFTYLLCIIYVSTVCDIFMYIGILLSIVFNMVVSLCSNIFFTNIATYMKMIMLPHAANEMMYYLIRLYADIVCIGVSILFGICTLLLYIYITNKKINNIYTIRNYRISGGTEALIDVLLFVLPTFIICYILTPTLIHLYRYDVDSQTIASAFTIEVVGNQWYWLYKYNIPRILYCKDLELLYDITELVIEIESRMSEDTVERLHSVDNVLVIPKDTAIALDITSMDVIHSFGVPQLGIKIDAVPGRYQHGIIYAEREGIYYGHCYELCGTYHGFMPIVVKVVSAEEFVLWCLQMLHINMASLILHALFGV